MNRRESLVALAALGAAQVAAQVAAAQPENRVWRVGNVNGVSAPVASPEPASWTTVWRDASGTR